MPGCRTSSDCSGGAFCSTPGQPRCGGACLGVQHPCAADSDCAADGGNLGTPSICALVECSCPSNSACQPGCSSNADCEAGTSCGSNHHCAPIACPVTGSNAGCPPDFVCGSELTCMRMPCQSDAVCTGACVLGFCYGSGGSCWLPAP